jgi:hypothetical protein
VPIERSKLADISEIVRSVAILITLIYLTVEMNQNTTALNAQSREAVLSAAQLELQILIERPHIVLNMTGTESLSPEEQSELDSTLTLLLRSREYSWLQFRDGTIDSTQWETEHAVLVGILDSDRVRLWWTKLGRFVFGREYVAFVDDLIAKTEVTNQINAISKSWTD